MVIIVPTMRAAAWRAQGDGRTGGRPDESPQDLLKCNLVVVVEVEADQSAGSCPFLYTLISKR